MSGKNILWYLRYQRPMVAEYLIVDAEVVSGGNHGANAILIGLKWFAFKFCV